MNLDWNALPRPIVALSPMADMTDSAFCRTVRAISGRNVIDAGPPLSAGGGSALGGSPTLSIRRGKTETSLPSPSQGEGRKGSPASPARQLVVFREMVSAEAVVRGNEKTLGMTDLHPDERPLVQQLFGSDPDVMAEAAANIEAEHRPEGFDINMGCPVYKIVHNFNGAALMKEPTLATRIIQKMKAAISVPLSVKIRAGWSDPKECLEFCKVVEAAGADLITIHGRTKCQGYSDKSDWSVIKQVKERVSIPVLANGDIHTAPLVPLALQTTACDGVLIARGALGNPWFFAQAEAVLTGSPLPPVSWEERKRVIRLHAKLHLEQYGERGMVTFRKHLTWYVKGQPGASSVRQRLHAVSTMRDLEDALEEISK
ncbi:tRNA-dihydrouridine synthase [Candidatus Uhrbacteria bacterium]|nr:tRNA-dihydrouridine synthase [Candidatus Uhrbacteria bacterium]